MGTFALVLCALSISLSDSPFDPIFHANIANLFDVQSFSVEKIRYPISAWVPVVFGIITPIGFSTNGMLAKHLVGPKVRFDTSTLAFTGYFVVNVIVIISAMVFWSSWGMNFDHYLFWLGLAGSIINTLGIVCA